MSAIAGEYPYLHEFKLDPLCDKNCDDPHCNCGSTWSNPVHNAKWRDIPNKPIVIGHRGSGSGKGENTKASFKSAVSMGADWIEIDITSTSDGELALTHGLFCGERPIWELSSGDVPVEILTEDCIPVDTGVFIELKLNPMDLTGNGTLSALLRILASIALRSPVVVGSFDPVVVSKLAKMGIPSGWIVKQGMPTIEAVITARAMGVDVLMVHGPTADFGSTGWRHASDLLLDVKLWVWGATPESVSRYIQYGVSGVCGDDVAGLVRSLKGPLSK